MNNYLADTTVLIEHLRRNSQAKEFLEKYHPSISTVTIAELMQGARNTKDLKAIITLCESLSEISIDNKISRKAINLLHKLHLPHGLMFMDALIAATAIENKLILVTANIKHFEKITELQLISPNEAFQAL